MAVPKRKTSKSKRDKRRSHHSLKNINVIEDKDSGEPRISHRIDLSTGKYNGKEILIKKEKPEIAEIKSKIIIPGIKYLAFIGTGKNININLLSGKNIPKATRTPIIAPEAPTISELKESNLELIVAGTKQGVLMV